MLIVPLRADCLLVIPYLIISFADYMELSSNRPLISIHLSRVAEPEPKLLAGAGAGAGILKFRLRLPAPAPGQIKVVYLIIIHIE
jgi:hypothetical protein